MDLKLGFDLASGFPHATKKRVSKSWPEVWLNEHVFTCITCLLQNENEVSFLQISKTFVGSSAVETCGGLVGCGKAFSTKTSNDLRIGTLVINEVKSRDTFF